MLQEKLGNSCTIENNEETEEIIIRTSTGVVLVIRADGPTYDCPLVVVEQGG